MSGYEIEELARIEAALDDLVSPTSEDVFQATRPFDERAIASVAATRGEGGGAQPSVTDSVTTVASASSIRFPADSVMDAGGGVAVVGFPTHTARVVITDAEIRDLMNTYVAIVPPTETLGYAGMPSQLPVPVFASLRFSLVTNYDVVHVPTTIALVYGAWDVTVAYIWKPRQLVTAANPTADLAAVFQGSKPDAYDIFSPPMWDGLVGAGDLADNGLYLVLSNNNTSDVFTGGDPANKLICDIQYALVDMTVA